MLSEDLARRVAEFLPVQNRFFLEIGQDRFTAFLAPGITGFLEAVTRVFASWARSCRETPLAGGLRSLFLRTVRRSKERRRERRRTREAETPLRLCIALCRSDSQTSIFVEGWRRGAPPKEFYHSLAFVGGGEWFLREADDWPFSGLLTREEEAEESAWLAEALGNPRVDSGRAVVYRGLPEKTLERPLLEVRARWGIERDPEPLGW